MIAAEVRGLDLATALEEEEIQGIRKALLEYGVLIFPGQDLTESQHIAFARSFGLPKIHPIRLKEAKNPEIFAIDTADGAPTARWWHADRTALSEPPKASILQIRILPAAGGDSEWANPIAAYESLSPAMKKRLEGLRAEHVAWWDDQTRSIHPVVREQRETGRRGLFVNGIFTRRILNLPESCSWPNPRPQSYWMNSANMPSRRNSLAGTPGVPGIWPSGIMDRPSIACTTISEPLGGAFIESLSQAESRLRPISPRLRSGIDEG